MKNKTLLAIMIAIIIVLSVVTVIAVIQVRINIQVRLTVPAQYSLKFTPGWFDFGAWTYAGEEKNQSWTLKNTGNEKLYVYWTSDLENLTIGPYFDLEMYYNGTYWPSGTKQPLNPGVQVSGLAKVKMPFMAPAAPSYGFMIEALGDDSP